MIEQKQSGVLLKTLGVSLMALIALSVWQFYKLSAEDESDSSTAQFDILKSIDANMSNINAKVAELDSKINSNTQSMANLEQRLDSNLADASESAVENTIDDESQLFLERFASSEQDAGERNAQRQAKLEFDFVQEDLDEAWSVSKQSAIDEVFLYSEDSNYKDLNVASVECRSETCKLVTKIDGDEADVEIDLIEGSLMSDMHKLGLSRLRSSIIEEGGQKVRTYFVSAPTKKNSPASSGVP